MSDTPRTFADTYFGDLDEDIAANNISGDNVKLFDRSLAARVRMKRRGAKLSGKVDIHPEARR
jgi:hypothetical protein